MTTTHGGDDAPRLTSTTMLSVRQVGELTGKPGQPKDRKTVMTHIKDGRYPNAVQEPTGRKVWTVPVQDLVDAGDLDPTQVLEVAATLEALRETRQVAELRVRVTELETELATLSALAAERARTVEFLERMLALAIPAGGAR